MLRVDQVTRGEGQVFVPDAVGGVFADAGYCGRSFNDGLLRFHDSVSGPLFRDHVWDAFPEAKARGGEVFASDWRGRQLVAVGRGEPASGSMFVADIGRGVFSSVSTMGDFARLMGDDRALARALDAKGLARWRKTGRAGHAVIGFSQCVELVVPLYVGGKAEPSNLALTDMDVSWTVGVQIWSQVRDLPAGTKIRLQTD